MNVFIYIATLGPEGTDSERAAMYFTQRKRTNYQIRLSGSFEEALQNVVEGEAKYGIVPAAYDKLFELHCLYSRDLVISEAFPLATKEMVLAKNPKAPNIRSVALHRTTDTLAPLWAEKIYIPSKPLCAQAVSDGKADACIASKDTADIYGLEVVKNFGEIPMSWEVFVRR